MSDIMQITTNDEDFVADSQRKITEELRKETRSIYNRLRSIDDDAAFVHKVSSLFPSYPVVANERCGTWYVDPALIFPLTVYFKSTDGHTGQWDFNLRRANTHLLEIISQHGGAIVVDSTRRGKSMPDSFSKTIPMWCATWSASISRVHNSSPQSSIKQYLHTPPRIVSASEHDQMAQLVPEFVKRLETSPIDIESPAKILGDKPIRPIWITRDHNLEFPPNFADAEFFPLICVSASSTSTRRVEGSANDRRGGYLYVQGSADDHELWSMGLTPQLFWKHRKALLDSREGCIECVRSIVGKACPDSGSGLGTPFNFVRDTCIAVGGRAAGRPPACWQEFDAVINCGAPEFEANKDQVLRSRYLFLPIPEGKKGQVALGESITPALEFARPFVEHGKKVLVHCSQGVDRSVGISLAILSKFFDNQGEYNENAQKDITKDSIKVRLLWITTSRIKANPSRVTLKRVNRHFLDYF